MLVGYPPFRGKDATSTFMNIVNWRETLTFPTEANLSWSAKSLIKSLLCGPEYRLGANRGLAEFKTHPFFQGVDWDNLHLSKPRFIPDLHGPTDVRYFDHYDPLPNHGGGCASGARLASLEDPVSQQFLGFEYTRD